MNFLFGKKSSEKSKESFPLPKIAQNNREQMMSDSFMNADDLDSNLQLQKDELQAILGLKIFESVSRILLLFSNFFSIFIFTPNQTKLSSLFYIFFIISSNISNTRKKNNQNFEENVASNYFVLVLFVDFGFTNKFHWFHFSGRGLAAKQIWSLACMVLHILGFVDSFEQFPHEMYFCGVFFSFFLISLIGISRKISLFLHKLGKNFTA